MPPKPARFFSDPTRNGTTTLRALVERIGYEGRTGKIAVTFRSAGFKDLCEIVNDEQ